MKNLNRKVILVIILILSMPVLNCCRSNPTKEKPATVEIYFPSFPTPGKATITPIDIDGKIVRDNDTEIMNVVIPFWYWIMITNYVTETEEAVAMYQATLIKE